MSLSALTLRLSADNLKVTIYGPRGEGNDDLGGRKGFIGCGDVFQACRELARSGYRYEERLEPFVVMTVEELDALRLKAARAQLHRGMDEAEDDYATA